ncbi:MAG TPA: tetratricopeptide repeat protein [Kofleriaceae bacterium]|nr:tetratricopeptide repeat protein [Kofleriaceae bacterium]
MLLVATAAQAEPSAAADKAFKAGRDAFRAGRYAEACQKFEDSQRLDPELGTLFNLAQCDEKIGKLASALAAFRQIVSDDSNEKRKALAGQYAVKLENRVPKLLVELASPPSDLKVMLDDRAVAPNQPIEVDDGSYTVTATAAGFKPFKTTVAISGEGSTTPVQVSLEKIDLAPPTGPSEPPPVAIHEQPMPAPPVAHSHRKTYAVATLVVGGGALIASGAFGVIASGKWNDAKAVCGGTICPTQPATDMANSLADTARSAGNLATIFGIVGGVGVAAGITLWLTAPSEHAVRVTANPHGIDLVGRF